MWGFPQIEVPQMIKKIWFIVENAFKLDDDWGAVKHQHEPLFMGCTGLTGPKYDGHDGIPSGSLWLFVVTIWMPSALAARDNTHCDVMLYILTWKNG